MEVITILEVERRRRGLSATELARRMKVAKSTVSAIERQRREPSSTFKISAAAALGVDVRDLWPEFFALAREPGDDGLLRAGDKLIAYSSRTRARSAASHLGKLTGAGFSVRGPRPAEALAAEVGVFPGELRIALVLDPEAEALVDVARSLSGAPGR
jgi:transcriptional regulator with XRE-family HTH domain